MKLALLAEADLGRDILTRRLEKAKAHLAEKPTASATPETQKPPEQKIPKNLQGLKPSDIVRIARATVDIKGQQVPKDQVFTRAKAAIDNAFGVIDKLYKFDPPHGFGDPWNKIVQKARANFDRDFMDLSTFVGAAARLGRIQL